MPYDAFITYIDKELKMARHTVRAYRGDLEQFRAFCTADTGSDAPEAVYTAVIRRWGVYPEGMSFAILIMNGAVPLINRYVRPRRFSPKRKEVAA